MNQPVSVLVYSDNRATRRQVIDSLGERPDQELPEFVCVEVATFEMLSRRMDRGGVDVAILDGEATPAGGIGIAKQLKDELKQCPPLIVLIGRAVDGWLARWSGADAAIPHPVEPMALTETTVRLLRHRARFATR